MSARPAAEVARAAAAELDAMADDVLRSHTIDGVFDDVEADAAAEYERLRTLSAELRAVAWQGWRAVSGKGPLPPPATAVLVQFLDHTDEGKPGVELGERRPGGEWYVCGGAAEVTVTHWQPLPELAT